MASCIREWSKAVDSLRGNRGEELLSDLDTEDVGETGTYAHWRIQDISISVAHVRVDSMRIIFLIENAQVVVALLWRLIRCVWLVVVLLEVTVSEGVLTLED